jgi:hypothetical protein
MLYDELKPLVVDGPGWAFVQKFDKAKDGRRAVLTLESQAEGFSAMLTWKAKAYAAIASAMYWHTMSFMTAKKRSRKARKLMTS